MKYCLSFGLVVFGCVLPSGMVTSWTKDVSSDHRVSSILVTAISNDGSLRETLENNFVDEFADSGYEAEQSLKILPTSFVDGRSPDKEEIFREISSAGTDGILTIALLENDFETRTAVATSSYDPIAHYGYYRKFWGYYNAWYPALFAEGYYREDKVYFIETNLYEASTEQLIWSGHSKSMSLSELKSYSNEFARVVCIQLRKKRLLQK